MPSYHSSFNETEASTVCGCSILPLKTTARGPAPLLPVPAAGEPSEPDIVDEAITFFRANVLFRSFEIKGGADRVLVYLTLFIHLCLKKLERTKTRKEGETILAGLGREPSISVPGTAHWPLGTMFPSGDGREREACKEYLRQLRQATVQRLADHVYFPDGSPHKFWIAFHKRKFMGKELNA